MLSSNRGLASGSSPSVSPEITPRSDRLLSLCLQPLTGHLQKHVIQRRLSQCDRRRIQISIAQTFDHQRDGPGRLGDVQPHHITISLHALNDIPEAAPATLDLLHGWALDDVPPDTFSVAVHIEDAGGNVALSGDYGLPNTRPYSCHAAHVPLESLPPGNYRVLVGVYRWQTGERLTGTQTADGEPVDRVLVGTFVKR